VTVLEIVEELTDSNTGIQLKTEDIGTGFRWQLQEIDRVSTSKLNSTHYPHALLVHSAVLHYEPNMSPSELSL
jgi:hypothetical protein